ncbi:hypothetical protein DBP19_01470 [Streptomyces sp. CS090A]|nr:hypothetical protein DBP19_01470 [Streptomyces sp. CS090A]
MSTPSPGTHPVRPALPADDPQETGVPRVIDFGIARAADATGLTGTGLRIGIAEYMAREQAMGLPVTPAADVFALGALAVHVAGGTPPFGPGYVLSPADCEKGLATEPVTGLWFDDLADERPFCVRRSDGREIVIVRLVHAEAEDGPVAVVLSRYTKAG